MAYNEDIDPPPPQDISNVFSSSELLAQSSSDSAKYKPAWYNARLIRSYILSAEENPDTCSRALSIALNHKEISSIMVMTGTIFPKIYANVISRNEQKEKNCPIQHLSVIYENKQKTEFF